MKKEGFTALALDIFHFQYQNNKVYRAYADALGVSPAEVLSVEKIPCLPVRFFKSHKLMTGDFSPAIVFESSGSTGMINSHHYIKDTRIYETSFQRCFELFYGPVRDWCIIGLLPSYLERSNSSLVYMVKKLAELSAHPASGFYLYDYDKLADTLRMTEQKGQPVLLIGVTYALLYFAEQYPMQLKHTVLMETGGMKGRRKEMVREDVHTQLRKAFGASLIHSEYGMTELLSQAYSPGNGLFHCPPWMKVLVREEEDPFQVSASGNGVINVIDLANVHSCSFLATDDAGRLYDDGSFEVLGRVDGSDIRGCSLMVI